MVLVVFAVLDLALAYRLQIRLENAAREGASYAQLHPDQVRDCGDGSIWDRVVAEDDGVEDLHGFEVVVLREGLGGTNVPVSGCSTTIPRGTRVTVEARAEHRLLTPLVSKALGSTVVRVAGTAEVEVQA